MLGGLHTVRGRCDFTMIHLSAPTGRRRPAPHRHPSLIRARSRRCSVFRGPRLHRPHRPAALQVSATSSSSPGDPPILLSNVAAAVSSLNSRCRQRHSTVTLTATWPSNAVATVASDPNLGRIELMVATEELRPPDADFELDPQLPPLLHPAICACRGSTLFTPADRSRGQWTFTRARRRARRSPGCLRSSTPRPTPRWPSACFAHIDATTTDLAPTTSWSTRPSTPTPIPPPRTGGIFDRVAGQSWPTARSCRDP